MAANRLRQGLEGRQLRVAGLIIVGLLILAYGIYRVGKIFDVFADRYEIVTLVPSALGLREGAPVTLAGQRIGQVAAIDFIPIREKRGEDNLRIRLAINEAAQDQVRGDSRAFLRTEGLLGEKFIDIQPGTLGAQVLQRGDTLLAGRSVDMDQFITQASGALDQATTIVTDLRDITGGLAQGQGTLGKFLVDEQLYQRMVAATTELTVTLGEINRADGTLGRLIRDPALYRQMQTALARVDSIGAQALGGRGSLGLLLQDESIFRNLAGTTARADSAMIGLNQLVGRMQQGEGSLQKLLTDPQLYDEFLKAVVDLQTLLNDVRAEPGKYKPDITVRVF